MLCHSRLYLIDGYDTDALGLNEDEFPLGYQTLPPEIFPAAVGCYGVQGSHYAASLQSRTAQGAPLSLR